MTNLEGDVEFWVFDISEYGAENILNILKKNHPKEFEKLRLAMLEFLSK